MPRVRYVIWYLHPADPQDGGLGDLALFHLGKCGTPGWQAPEVNESNLLIFQQGKQAQRGRGIPASSLRESNARKGHTLVHTCGYFVQSCQHIIDLGPSGPGGSGGWSKTGSDEGKDPRTRGTRKTQTWALFMGKCAPSAWGRDYRPERPGLGLAPALIKHGWPQTSSGLGK